VATGGRLSRRGVLLVLAVFAAARWLVFLRDGEPGASSPRPRSWARARGYVTFGIILVLLTAGVIAATDWLGYAAGTRVTDYNGRWWGVAEETPWQDATAHAVAFLSRDLAITVDADQLTATYTVTVPASSPVAALVESDTNSEAGDDFVSNALGQVQVGEFRYGFTGDEISTSPLTFTTPRLQVAENTKKQPIATITVVSDSDRLYEHSQQIAVSPPAASGIRGPAMAIVFQAPDGQIMSPVGVSVGNVANGTADLLVKSPANVSFAVSEEGSSSSWFEGLRATGGITLPVADGFFYRLDEIVVYGVLLWAFYRARRRFPGSRLVSVGLKTAQTVVMALLAVAVLNLAYDLCAKPGGSTSDRDYLLAGPMGLLLGGAAVVWPLACWRVGAPDADPYGIPESARRRSSWRRTLVRVLVHLAIVALYWFRVYRLGMSPLTNAQVLAGTAIAVAAVPLLVRLVLGRGPLTWVASAGLLGAVLAAAASWPLLLYTGYSRIGEAMHVNPWGKGTYVAVAVIAAAGLCVLGGRMAWLTFSGRRFRTGRIIAVTAVVVVILVAIVPDALSESGIASPHASGLAPVSLFDLFAAVPQLLDWLMLLLAIAVVMRLPPQPDPRAVARDIALPIGLFLLYWFNTWLYLPITAIAGAVLIRWLLIPADLATVPRNDDSPATWADEAAADWRRADFITGQQQALAASSTDALRDSVLTGKSDEFQQRLARLTGAQDDLASKLRGYQRAAEAARIGAFSYRGAALDPGSAAVGAVTGAVLGIIPAAVTMFTTQPPSANGSFPVLAFFGVTAWNLLSWAGIGWFIGYFLPLIRGDSGMAKALWLFLVTAVGSLPNSLIWNDASDWAATMIGDLEFLVFFMVATVIIGDLRALRRARLPPADWVRVNNWRFVATWSAAIVAAVGTIAITFATTTVSDLSQQLLRQPPSSSAGAGQSGR
jgi:hypothetical protein